MACGDVYPGAPTISTEKLNEAYFRWGTGLCSPFLSHTLNILVYASFFLNLQQKSNTFIYNLMVLVLSLKWGSKSCSSLTQYKSH